MDRAAALSLDSPQAYSVLGQPLLLAFPLGLRPGERLGLDCVSAEVTAGTASLPASMVSVQLEGESETSLRAIRVLSAVAIDEPIVNVSVRLGCPVQLIRQFSILMDPPGAHALAAPAVLAPLVSPRVLSPALRAALATSEARPRALMGASLPAPAAPAQPRAVPVGNSEPRVAATKKAAKAEKAAAVVAAAVPSATLPQLRLEPMDAGAIAAAEHAAAAAASAAEAAMVRLQTVEAALLNLQSEQRSNALKLSALRGDGAAATVEGSGLAALPWGWGLGLGALILLLGAGLGFLWRDRRRAQPSSDSDWWGGEPQEAAPVAVVRPETQAPSAPPALDQAPQQAQEQTMVLPHGVDTESAAASAEVPAEPAHEELSGLERISQLMAGDLSLEPLSVQFIDPAAPQAAAAVPSSLSVEELIDLEQQVDFFLVLGQDEAAVDLLQAQLRQAGNSMGSSAAASALPYLKLMEICQQRGDALAFADIAGRFALQFNVPPPAWELDLAQGRGLEGYEDVILGLQARWSDSGASMVSLQKLLAASGERAVDFDLPALRDLLLLYSVARDRSEHEVRGEEIDLFLPLDAKPGSGGDGSHPTGFDLMATMPWQGKVGPGKAPVSVDILLDDAPG